MTKIRTTCTLCGAGCGMIAWREGERGLSIDGDIRHPASRGTLCERGFNLAGMLEPAERLLHPLVNGRRVAWDRVLSLIARKLEDIVARHGPESVAFMLSGVMLTEDLYAANKLMKGYIGAANIDVGSPAHAADALAHVRAFGEDVVPASLEDVDRAELVVMLGPEAATRHPIAMEHIQAARRERRTKLAIVDPRGREQCDESDLCLPIKPRSEIALMNGLLAWCLRAGLADEQALANVAVPKGFWPALDKGTDIWSVARACEVPAAEVQRFFETVAAAPRTVTLYSFGGYAGAGATDQVSAVLNFHLATGRIGKPGAGPISVGGEANAMGLREVGALRSVLAAHRDFAPECRAAVQRFWGSPRMASRPGLEGEELIEAVLDGRIKFLWLMGGYPAGDLKGETRWGEALAACPWVVVSDPFDDSESASHADVVLPVYDWAERDGTTTGFDRLLSRQRPVLPPAGEARPDWWVVTEVARRMGWQDAFYYRAPADIYREHARLSAYGNEGKRLFDLRRHAAISNPAYDEMTPWRWGGAPFAQGHFPTADGKARLVATQTPPLDGIGD